MIEICDWKCPSISRYVGTMLNGAVSLFEDCRFIIFPRRLSVPDLRLAMSIKFPLCGNHVEWRSISFRGCRFIIFPPIDSDSDHLPVFLSFACVIYLAACFLCWLFTFIRPQSCFLTMVCSISHLECRGYWLLLGGLGCRRSSCAGMLEFFFGVFWCVTYLSCCLLPSY